jgi:transposase
LSLTLPPSTKIYLSLAPCDMRKGFDGLSAQVRNILQLDPFIGAVFLFRGKRGDRLKALVWDGSGLCLNAKRLERGKFVWPRTQDGVAVRLSSAQVAMLIEGLDWRQAIVHERVSVPALARSENARKTRVFCRIRVAVALWLRVCGSTLIAFLQIPFSCRKWCGRWLRWRNGSAMR